MVASPWVTTVGGFEILPEGSVDVMT